jgi:peroxiredoxin
MLRFMIVTLMFGMPATLCAGEFNKSLNVGDAAPAWSNLPGVDGKKHSLADLKDKDAVVVVFTCNSCPMAVEYEDRIMAFAKRHAGKVAVVAINVNTIEEDRLPRMVDRAKEREFNFAYLYDESQKIARAYGADKTPEFFVLDRNRKVVYMGAMDDKSPPSAAGKFYLEDAVQATLAGKSVSTAETLARGCRIRFARKK